MKSMKREMKSMEVSSSEYPYGLTVCLDKESLLKLGITELPEIGAEMKMMAKVYVCSKHESENDMSMTLQICDMDIKAMKESESAESKLYGDKA